MPTPGLIDRLRRHVEERLGTPLQQPIQNMNMPGQGVRMQQQQPLVQPGQQPGMPQTPQPTPGLVQRVKDTAYQVLNKILGPAPQMPANSLPDIKARIHQAARARMKISFNYKNKPRVGAPYSYRFRDKFYPQIPQLYLLEDGATHIKAFRTYQISNLTVTSQTFVSIWAVEI